MHPNHIALIHNIFQNVPAVLFSEVQIECLDVNSVLVVLVIHRHHIKTQGIDGG